MKHAIGRLRKKEEDYLSLHEPYFEDECLSELYVIHSTIRLEAHGKTEDIPWKKQ